MLLPIFKKILFRYVRAINMLRNPVFMVRGVTLPTDMPIIFHETPCYRYNNIKQVLCLRDIHRNKHNRHSIVSRHIGHVLFCPKKAVVLIIQIYNNKKKHKYLLIVKFSFTY